jgi:hypothetical protein
MHERVLHVMQIRRCQPSESRITAEWIAEMHYLRSKPPGFVQVLEFCDGSSLIGAMILGRPSSKAYDTNLILELNRVFFRDGVGHCVESQGLSMMRKHVRTWLPGVRLLISYSDPSVGHAGTIYAADGWAPLGMTSHKSGYGWRSRPNRRDDPVTPKQRWVRTP